MSDDFVGGGYTRHFVPQVWTWPAVRLRRHRGRSNTARFRRKDDGQVPVEPAGADVEVYLPPEQIILTALGICNHVARYTE